MSILNTEIGRWTEGTLPPNARLGEGTLLTGEHAFRRFRCKLELGLTIGAHGTMEGVQFAVGEAGLLSIGDHCVFTNAVLLCEKEVRIGNYVMIGWNATIADSDFHPIEPAFRLLDARACSPLANGMRRPPIAVLPVVIEDDVWIGPNAVVLKGVTIGSGAFIEPGAIVTRDVPPRARVQGNPARVVGTVPD